MDDSPYAPPSRWTIAAFSPPVSRGLPLPSIGGGLDVDGGGVTTTPADESWTVVSAPGFLTCNTWLSGGPAEPTD